MQVASGDRAGRPVRRVLQDPAEGIKTGDLCYGSRGFSLHAATRIPTGNKAGLERLCNYVARPPLAAGSLKRLSKDEYGLRRLVYFSIILQLHGLRPLRFSKLQ